VAVPAAAGVPVTHRGVAQEFSVVSVHVAPDDERSTVNWPALAATHGTLVLLMGVERLAAVAETLIRYGRSGSTPVSVVADGTLPTQRTIFATLDTVAPRVFKDGIRPPAVVVIGEVVNVAAEIARLMRGLQPGTPGGAGAHPAAARSAGPHPGGAQSAGAHSASTAAPGTDQA
jgi:uroporphyrin-III C-methyltransferase / precorrin-2 dehydrogenase / sirohydrochlorin ferrochelatase